LRRKLDEDRMSAMSAGIALLLLAQAATASPTVGPAAPTPVKKASTTETCIPGQRSTNPNEVVICAPKIEGYRLDPDVLEARREKRNDAGRPTRPGPSGARTIDCATIGPMGCRGGASINLAAAALTAAEMATRLAEGKEIGSMFVTDPHPSEYQLYLEAKARREAREAEKAAARVRTALSRAQEGSAGL
jgi:hypothetical protein